jgi:hypothetical protein
MVIASEIRIKDIITTSSKCADSPCSYIYYDIIDESNSYRIKTDDMADTECLIYETMSYSHYGTIVGYDGLDGEKHNYIANKSNTIVGITFKTITTHNDIVLFVLSQNDGTVYVARTLTSTIENIISLKGYNIFNCRMYIHSIVDNVITIDASQRKSPDGFLVKVKVEDASNGLRYDLISAIKYEDGKDDIVIIGDAVMKK